MLTTLLATPASASWWRPPADSITDIVTHTIDRVLVAVNLTGA